MKARSIFLITGLLALNLALLQTVSVQAATLSEQHVYCETVGSAASKTLDWQLLAGEPRQLKTRLGEEEDLTIVDPALATRTWQLLNRKAGTEILVERTGNQLKISGRLRGKPVQERKTIDAAPWYQTLSLSLRTFLRSRQAATEFWMLRPATLQLYKLRAVEKAREEIEVLGEKTLTRKVEVRLAGIGGLFWKAHYWFRASDALFVRYCGPTGLPGSPNTVVILHPTVQ